MIFYFTGTGNSKYIADRLGECFDEKLVDMGEAVKNGSFTYDCSKDKYIGFVFPTYAWSIPYVVRDFVLNMELDNIDDAYIFAINNCGATEGRSLYDINKLLADKNIRLNFARSLEMPDNYLILQNPPEKEVQNKMFRSANIKLANIINNILRNKNSVHLNKGILFYGYKLLNIIFTKFMNNTSKFYVSDDCVSCGLCSEICNTNTINIEDGKPVWVDKTCVQCLACLNRCPVEAIEYGKKTVGRTRYINPFVKFDKYVEEQLEESEITEEVAEEPKTTEEVAEESIQTVETEHIVDNNEN